MNYDIKIGKEILDNGQLPYDAEREDQIQTQLNERNHQNLFANLIGKWPGDETWEEVIEELDK